MTTPEQACGAAAAARPEMPVDPEAARADARADAEPGARGAEGGAPRAAAELPDVLGAGAAALFAAGAVMWLGVLAWGGIRTSGLDVRFAQGALGMLSSPTAIAASGLWRVDCRGAWGAGRVGLGGLLAVKLVVEVSLWIALVAKVQGSGDSMVAAVLAAFVAWDTIATLLAAAADGLMLYVVFTAPAAPLAAPTAEQWRDLLGCGATSLHAAMALVWLGTLGAGARWLSLSLPVPIIQFQISRMGSALVAQGVFGVLLSAAAGGGYGLWRVDFRGARATLKASLIGLLAVKLFVEVGLFIAVEVVVGEAYTAGNVIGSLLAVGADLLLLYAVAAPAAAAAKA